MLKYKIHEAFHQMGFLCNSHNNNRFVDLALNYYFSLFIIGLFIVMIEVFDGFENNDGDTADAQIPNSIEFKCTRE